MENQTTHGKFMTMAINLGVENVKNGGGPFGAVIVKDNQLIATGVNRVTATHDPTAHAEVNAIREACKKLKNFELKGCVLYTSCEPCPMCLSASYWSRIDRIYFAASRIDAACAHFDDDFIYREIPLSPEKRSIQTLQLPIQEKLLPFKIWELQKDKTLY